MLKKLSSMFIVFIMLFTICSNTYAGSPPENVQGVWIATIFGIDYPSVKCNPEAQKKEFSEKLNELELMGINTVILQVRPKGDAFYKSSINPWSDALTGTQGKDPGYDPMEYMINETHKRGMLFYAWLNPYRVTTTGVDVSLLSKNHPARLNPDMVMSYNDALYYNPAREDVKRHIVSTVEEIVDNYSVDGIVFDDYFYPSKYPLPEGEDKDGNLANSRRKHINDMIYRVGKAIRNKDSNVVFGVSPSGIWKNVKSDPTGSNTSGYESYYGVYADSRTWIKNEWIDFISPQIYWEIGHRAADYETLVKWWSKEVEGTKVKLYISQNVYRDNVAKEVDKQLQFNQSQDKVSGSIYYNLSNLLADREGCKSKINDFNKSQNEYNGKKLIQSYPIEK